jgi:type I restriction enzyme S subunit
LPPIEQQRRIASILGALDDKMELNRRMNETLEAMARALFKSWFVDFDPVRTKAQGGKPAGMDADTAKLFPNEVAGSELGAIPKGWKATTLGHVVEVFDSRRIPLSAREREQRRGPFPYHGAASMMGQVDDFLFDGVYALMGEDGSVTNQDGSPVLQYVWGKFWVNNHAHVLRGTHGISTEHILLHLKNSNIGAFVTGAVQPKLSQGNMNRIPFVCPSAEVGEAFGRMTEPLFAGIRINTEQSGSLTALRDILLPKLLSGELPTTSRGMEVLLGQIV